MTTNTDRPIWLKTTIDFKSIFEATKGMRFVFLADSPSYTIAAVSDQMSERVAKAREHLIGRSIFEIFPGNPEDPDFTGHKNLKESLDHVVAYKEEHQMRRQRYDLPMPDGSFQETYWNNYSTPVFDERKEVVYIIHTTEDITSQVIHERNQKMSSEVEKAFRLLMQAPWVIGIAKGEDYVLEMANDSAFRLWNKSKDIEGKSLRKTIPELESQGIFEIFDKVRTTGVPYCASEFPVTSLINGKKQLRYFDIVYQPLFEDGLDKPTGVFTMSYDVTDLVVSKQKLQESEARLQKIISIETVGVIYFDLEGNINDCNAAFERMSGYSRKDMQSGHVRWTELTPPEFFDATERSRNELLTKGTNTPYEKQYIRPDGSRWWGLFAGKRLNEKECVEFVQDITLIKQVEQELEVRVKARTRDLERLTEELLRSNQSLEQFAYAASHDMKEPLRKAMLFSDRLKHTFKGEATEIQNGIIIRLENAILRMQTLIDDLLTYSHLTLQPRGLEQVDLNDVLAGVLKDLDMQIESRNAVVTVDTLPSIVGHYRQLQQLFENLIMNSLKYSREEVTPVINISCEKVDKERFGMNPYYVITVRDNGIGFEQHHAEKIFEVFARLHGKNDYTGTGIGLAIVRRVMESHKGFVEAEGTPGAGAVFRLYFPITNE